MLGNRIAGLVLGASLGLTAGAALADDVVTLNVWSDTPRLSMFDLFDKTHDKVKLKVVTVAPADLVAKIQLALRAKSEIPDVIFMSDIAYTAQLSTRQSNYLMDLTDKVPKALQDQFYPNGNAPCWVNGKLLCLRNDLAHMIVWYDKDAMKALGKDVPATWEDFEKLGADLAPKGLALGTGVEAWPVYATLMSDGCDLALPVEGKPDTLKINLTTDKCLKPARLIDAMVKNGSLTKIGPFEPDFVTLAKGGKIPLLIGPTWFGEYVIKPTYQWPAGKLAAATSLKWEDQKQPLTWSWGGGTYGGWRNTAHPDRGGATDRMDGDRRRQPDQRRDAARAPALGRSLGRAPEEGRLLRRRQSVRHRGRRRGLQPSRLRQPALLRRRRGHQDRQQSGGERRLGGSLAARVADRADQPRQAERLHGRAIRLRPSARALAMDSVGDKRQRGGLCRRAPAQDAAEQPARQRRGLSAADALYPAARSCSAFSPWPMRSG